MNEIARFNARSASASQMNNLPRGIMGGLGGAGLPRPSGAGSTRQPDGVCRGAGGGGGGGGLFGDESGARPLTVAPWVLKRPGEVSGSDPWEDENSITLSPWSMMHRT